MGNDKIPCIELDLTLDKEKELNIRLNKSGGSFDFDLLQEHFDTDDLVEFGFADYEFTFDDLEPLNDFSEKNKEIDIDELDQEMKLTLSFTESEYEDVKEALSKIAQTPEEAIKKLLEI